MLHVTEDGIHTKPYDQDLPASLRSLLRGRVCIVGVGNRMRGDDGVGPRVIDARRSETRGDWIDAGIAPENYLEPIVRSNPDVVLIVDAVAFGGFPGECRLIESSELDTTFVSTHVGSLSVLSDYLSARTGARLRVLAIQPASIELRKRLSPKVEETCLQLSELFSDVLASAGDNTG